MRVEYVAESHDNRFSIFSSDNTLVCEVGASGNCSRLALNKSVAEQLAKMELALDIYTDNAACSNSGPETWNIYLLLSGKDRLITQVAALDGSEIDRYLLSLDPMFKLSLDPMSKY